MSLASAIKAASRAAARELLFGKRPSREDRRRPIRDTAQQLRNELAADKLQKVRAALAAEQALPVIEAAVAGVVAEAKARTGLAEELGVRAE